MKFKKLLMTVASVFAALACCNLSACGHTNNDNTNNGIVNDGDVNDGNINDGDVNDGDVNDGDVNDGDVNDGNAAQRYVQQLNYEESTATINNPDQGFYRHISVKVTEDGITYNKKIINSYTQLYHLRIDISAFSKAVNGESDKQLTAAALDGINDLLSNIKSQDKNAIVRFAYDPSYSGNKDKEPSLQMILNHIEDVCSILNGYYSTITAIEVGMIGPWGEMHSSAIANAANITPITQAFLSNTDGIPILVRTPKMIYNFLGITVNDIDGYSIPVTHEAYRLGLYNDGYLGSDSDLGTYTNRQKEIEFLSKQTNHLPYGGEVVVPTSTLHDIDKCLPEMYKLNLSYLNVSWNNQVIDKWKNSYYTAECGTDEIYYDTTAFTYIENHLGYRYVLTKSTFEYAEKFDNLKIELNLKNVGFGNLNKTKQAKLILTDEEGAVAYTKNVGEFKGGSSFTSSLAPSLENGKYDVYLCLYGDEFSETPLYCVRFANNDMWSAELRANKIGSIQVKN